MQDFGRILPETHKHESKILRTEELISLTIAASVRWPRDRGGRVLPQVVETLELRRRGLRMPRREGGSVRGVRRLRLRKPVTRGRAVDIRFCV